MPDDKLKNLSSKIAEFGESERIESKAPEEGMNAGARAGLELVTSIVAGAVIGWALDNWLGTKPWMLIAFLFLGVGAGFMSVYRITNNLGSSVGFAALQKAQKTATKPPETTNTDEDED